VWLEAKGADHRLLLGVKWFGGEKPSPHLSESGGDLQVSIQINGKLKLSPRSTKSGELRID